MVFNNHMWQWSSALMRMIQTQLKKYPCCEAFISIFCLLALDSNNLKNKVNEEKCRI